MVIKKKKNPRAEADSFIEFYLFSNKTTSSISFLAFKVI